MFKAFSPDAAAAPAASATTDLGTAAPASKADIAPEVSITTDNPDSELPYEQDELPDAEDTVSAEATAGATEDADSDDGAALDASTVALAKRMGLDDDDLADFADTKELQRHLTKLDKFVLSKLKGQQQPVAEKPSGDSDKPATKGLTKFEKLKLELDPEKWDESAIAVLNSINDHYATHMESLSQQLEQVSPAVAQLHQQQLAAQAAEFDRQVDGFFDGLGEDYADTFGKGAMTKLDPHSPHAKQRQELVAEMFALADADARLGRAPMTQAELLTRALHARFHDKTKTQARQEIAKEVAKRRTQAVARPSSRDKTMNNVQRAVALASKVLGSADDSDDFDVI